MADAESNKRQFFRIDAEVPLAVRILPERQKGCLGCHTHLRAPRREVPEKLKEIRVNISEGGMQFVWKRPFHLGEYLEVRMLFRDIQDDLVVLCGEVVRTQHVRGDLYSIALKFPCRSHVMKRIISMFVMQKEREYHQRKIIGNL